MAYLDGWIEGGRSHRDTNADVVVFDHGPLFRLARLDAGRPASAQLVTFDRWWERRLHQWLGAVDLVVWLDASNETLWARVRDRH